MPCRIKTIIKSPLMKIITHNIERDIEESSTDEGS